MVRDLAEIWFNGNCRFPESIPDFLNFIDNALEQDRNCSFRFGPGTTKTGGSQLVYCYEEELFAFALNPRQSRLLKLRAGYVDSAIAGSRHCSKGQSEDDPFAPFMPVSPPFPFPPRRSNPPGSFPPFGFPPNPFPRNAFPPGAFPPNMFPPGMVSGRGFPPDFFPEDVFLPPEGAAPLVTLSTPEIEVSTTGRLAGSVAFETAEGSAFPYGPAISYCLRVTWDCPDGGPSSNFYHYPTAVLSGTGRIPFDFNLRRPNVPPVPPGLILFLFALNTSPDRGVINIKTRALSDTQTSLIEISQQ